MQWHIQWKETTPSVLGVGLVCDKRVSNLVFYAQSVITVILGRSVIREKEVLPTRTKERSAVITVITLIWHYPACDDKKYSS